MTLRGSWGRVGGRKVHLQRLADSGAGALAVEGGAVPGGPPVPARGGLGVAQVRGGFRGPIGAPCQADRRADAVVQAGEVAIGQLRIGQEAERDPPRQPFAVGEARALREAVAAGR